MNIIIGKRSRTPIYDQISSQIKELIAQGELQADDALPPMRKLAKSLQVSVITVQKAYEDLQRDGVLVSVAGKGTFVANNFEEVMREEQRKKVESLVKELAGAVRESDISMERVITLLRDFAKNSEESGGTGEEATYEQ